MSTLIIVLPLQAGDTNTRYEHVLVTAGVEVPETGSATPDQLPKAVRAVDETVVLVPVEAMAWHSVDLPKGVGPVSPRLRAVLSSLLEERVLDEMGDLHLAIEPKASAGSAAWVACCDRKWLQIHLQVLESTGQAIARIVPEFAPQSEVQKLNFLGDPRSPQFVLTGPGVEGGVVRLPLSSATLATALGNDALTAETLCLTEPSVAATAEQLAGSRVGIQKIGQRLAQATASAWDLAQFELASSGKIRATRNLAKAVRAFLQAPAWRPTRWGLGLLLLANLIGLNAWAWLEQSIIQERKTAINATLTQTFPQIKVVVDAPIQMEREMTALRQAAGAASSRDLEVMLGQLTQALGANQALTSIEFSGGEAKIRGLNFVDDELAAAVATLQKSGISLRQEGDLFLLKAEGPR